MGRRRNPPAGRKKLGELIRAQKETVGLNGGTRGQLAGGSRVVPPENNKPTLAEAGITKKLSHAWQSAVER